MVFVGIQYTGGPIIYEESRL